MPAVDAGPTFPDQDWAMINSSSYPLSDPRARGFRPGRSAAMALGRFVVLAGVDALSVWVTPPSADPVGTGLTAFVITMSIAGTWALVDGWRRPLRTGAVAWLLTGLAFVVVNPLPYALVWPAAEGGWTGLHDYLGRITEGAGFMFALVVVPAVTGLALGHVIRRSRRAERLATAAD